MAGLNTGAELWGGDCSIWGRGENIELLNGRSELLTGSGEFEIESSSESTEFLVSPVEVRSSYFLSVCLQPSGPRNSFMAY